MQEILTSSYAQAWPCSLRNKNPKGLANLHALKQALQVAIRVITFASQCTCRRVSPLIMPGCQEQNNLQRESRSRDITSSQV